MPTLVGVDSILSVSTDPVWAGVKLKADFSGLSSKPLQVRFWRDGVPVRSGDPAWAPGGVAVAYDHEAPLGVVSTWTAVALKRDGSAASTAAAVSVEVEVMAAEVDVWVKPLGNADRALALQVHTDQIEEVFDARVQSTLVGGRGLPSVSWDRRTPGAMSITMRTATKAEKVGLFAALDLGPVLVQLNPVYGIDDFYAVPAATTSKYFVGMFSPLRDVPTTFIPCTRPPTVDSPLRWPGKSYDTVSGPLSTYGDRQSAYPTYADVLFTTPAAPVGSGYGAGTYGTETYRA